MRADSFGGARRWRASPNAMFLRPVGAIGAWLCARGADGEDFCGEDEGDASPDPDVGEVGEDEPT